MDNKLTMAGRLVKAGHLIHLARNAQGAAREDLAQQALATIPDWTQQDDPRISRLASRLYDEAFSMSPIEVLEADLSSESYPEPAAPAGPSW